MISIIDDDVCAREATEAIIRSLGYALATHESAEDFLGSENINDTSCLITDVHTPGLNGYQRLRAMASRCQQSSLRGSPMRRCVRRYWPQGQSLS